MPNVEFRTSWCTTRFLRLFIRPPANFRQSFASRVLKNRDFFWYSENFPLYTRGVLGCLLGFWPSQPKPCGGNNAVLVTLDVSSLYTNIPHNEGIDACRRFLDTRTDKHIPTETLCDLLRIILTMNNFTFNQHHYLQIHGTAMGTKMAPSFANLFLGIFEINALSNAPFHPHTWCRYLDDIFMIWTEGLDHLKISVDYLNNIHPTIKFTSNHSLTNVPFLDVMVSLNNGTIETTLNLQTNTNTYLVYHAILNILKRLFHLA